MATKLALMVTNYMIDMHKKQILVEMSYLMKKLFSSTNSSHTMMFQVFDHIEKLVYSNDPQVAPILIAPHLEVVPSIILVAHLQPQANFAPIVQNMVPNTPITPQKIQILYPKKYL